MTTRNFETKQVIFYEKYRKMDELRGVLKNNDRARSARSLFFRTPRR